MSEKYHINPDTGRPNKCYANKRPCPIGGAHYESKEEAREAYSKTMNNEMDPLKGISRKDSSTSKENTGMVSIVRETPDSIEFRSTNDSFYEDAVYISQYNFRGKSQYSSGQGETIIGRDADFDRRYNEALKREKDEKEKLIMDKRAFKYKALPKKYFDERLKELTKDSYNDRERVRKLYDYQREMEGIQKANPANEGISNNLKLLKKAVYENNPYHFESNSDSYAISVHKTTEAELGEKGKYGEREYITVRPSNSDSQAERFTPEIYFNGPEGLSSRNREATFTVQTASYGSQTIETTRDIAARLRHAADVAEHLEKAYEKKGDHAINRNEVEKIDSIKVTKIDPKKVSSHFITGKKGRVKDFAGNETDEEFYTATYAVEGVEVIAQTTSKNPENVRFNIGKIDGMDSNIHDVSRWGEESNYKINTTAVGSKNPNEIRKIANKIEKEANIAEYLPELKKQFQSVIKL